ncbi:YbaB/EbfC family nucleoid-associated protein [Amycolatopsis sp. K13G38]|uniref:YbaB/EbfC family nucleoid-associated protein n=1 Tax=Amycolatopsis acididurans TaxID=2724524 RepID=A0ABX1JH91_9PSEU|nr:YbaB/EbfC family nucleoid-associated protein [Amycolatopsis acididurans]NKQ59162.1 YbaB/EbfC family nucleoid-associated protein [Amycolatopsis acididurans]
MSGPESGAGQPKRRPAPGPAAKKPDRKQVVSALAELSAEATSPDGAVAVSVNSDGVLTRLRLGDAVAKMTPAEIANLVMRTYAQAQRESAQRSGELLQSMGAGGYVMDRLRWRLQHQPDLQAGREVPHTEPARKPNPRDAHLTYLKDRSMPGYDLVPPIPEPPPAPKPGDDDWYEKGFRVMRRS